jgi:hypothetical protein
MSGGFKYSSTVETLEIMSHPTCGLWTTTDFEYRPCQSLYVVYLLLERDGFRC